MIVIKISKNIILEYPIVENFFKMNFAKRGIKEQNSQTMQHFKGLCNSNAVKMDFACLVIFCAAQTGFASQAIPSELAIMSII